MASCVVDKSVALIIAIMKRRGVDPEKVPEDPYVDLTDMKQVRQSRRYFYCKGFARFDAHNKPSSCLHTWKSFHAWCVLDLKQQCLAHRTCQECNKCNKKSSPWFDNRALEKMINFAVDLYLGLRQRKRPADDDDDDDDDENPLVGRPHDQARCDMCKQLGRSCWKKVKPRNEYPEEDDGDSYYPSEDEYDQYGYDERDHYSDEEYDDNYGYGYHNDDDYDPYNYEYEQDESCDEYYDSTDYY